jgi:DNA polymerase-3 subunit epsilon
LENSVEFLSEFSSWGKSADFAGRIGYDNDGKEIFTFGKYKGQRVEDIFAKEPSYYDWMMNGDFPQYTKRVITKIRLQAK